MQRRASWWSVRIEPWGMAALLLGLVLACYWPALRGGLLWDDQAHVTAPALRSRSGLGRIWFDVGATQQYYPVVHSAFWIENRMWGNAPLGYHLANVLFHATSCFLLALVLQRLGSVPSAGAAARPGRAASSAIPRAAGWLAAAIFAVHPVCVESVAWISEQKNTLSLVFYLLAALAYLDFDDKRRAGSYARALAFFLLALGTKSVTATLPAALLVMLWWRNGRLSLRRDAGPLAPWFAIAMVSGLFTAWVERRFIGAEGAGFDLSAIQRVLLAGRVVSFYLGKLIWPADLAFVYPHWDVPAVSPGWYGFLGGALALTAALWLFRRRCRGALAAWLFFIGSLFPALGFFNVYPFIFSYVADHFQYLASLGLIALAAGGVATMLARASTAVRVGGWGLCGALVAGLGFLANQQCRIYVNAETLYRATLARNPECWMAHTNLGAELAKSPAGEAEAMAHDQEALRIKPDYAEAHNNLAVELAKLPGREPEAIAHYGQALRIRPDYAETHANLANVLATIPGRVPEALMHYQQALRLKPDYADAHYNLANELAKLPGRLPEALAHYERALQLNPDHAKAHFNLANELAKLPGRAPDAIAHYEEAIRILPDNAGAHTNLANVLAAIPGRESEALIHYHQALRLKPDDAEIHYDLANELAKLPGRLPDALVHYERALQLNPAHAEAHFNLANELARLPGRAPEAIEHYEEALRIRPDYAEAHANLANVLAAIPGRVPEALAHYEEALRLNPDLAEVHYNLANELAKLPGYDAEAIHHYQETLRLKPDFARAQNRLAILYARQGRTDEAKRLWKRVLELDPTNEDAGKYLGMLERFEGR